MKTNVYGIYDSKAKAFFPPVFSPTHGACLRMFMDAANDKSGNIGRHPEDYSLHHIGEFDDSTGLLISCEKQENLGLASNFVKDNA